MWGDKLWELDNKFRCVGVATETHVENSLRQTYITARKKKNVFINTDQNRVQNIFWIWRVKGKALRVSSRDFVLFFFFWVKKEAEPTMKIKPDKWGGHTLRACSVEQMGRTW